MKVMKISFFVVSIWILTCALTPLGVATAQEKEKQKPGTTVDSWRQSLPPEAEVPASPEDMSNPATASSSAETQKTLLSLEQKLMESLKVGDADSLSLIIGNDFTFVNPRLSGKVTDRAKYLEHALRDTKLTAYEFDKTTVQIFGKTAVVTGRLKQSATVGGTDWSGTYLVTDVWVSRNGSWRVVTRHESLLPGKM